MSALDGPEDDKPMPLLDHLIELRRRLIYALLSFILVFVVCFYFAKPIFTFLIEPARADGYKVIVLDIFEFFFVTVKMSAFLALIIGFPLIATQIWAFVAPGLYRHEKAAFRPFLIATPFMFYAGCAIMYYVVMPYVINVMLALYTPEEIEKTLRASDYLERVLQLVFAFGFAFEVPVMLVLLVRVGLVSTATLKAKRRWAIVIAFVIAAVLTPPDVVSQFALAVPLLIFYEVAIWIGMMVERRRAQQDKAEAAQPGTAIDKPAGESTSS